jgi:hypothetical protein
MGATFTPGDKVRLTRSETLLFKGENFLGAPKGQEFSVLKQDAAQNQVYVGFHKPDGSLIAVTLPADALETSPPDGWSDLLRGAEAFRDGRYEESRRLLVRAAQEPKQRQMATNLATRFTAAAAGGANSAAALPSLREFAAQLCAAESYSLGLAVDLGTDRLAARAGSAAAPTKIDQEAIGKRVAAVTRAVANCRQAAALHRLHEASKHAREGLEAEPARPDLVAMQKKVTKELAEAEDRWKDADRMRRIPRGEVHALTALDRGLKLCVDHPGLVELKREMQGALESRTAPPLTPALLTLARATAPMAELEEGRKLYTTRCTECHDLDMVDSRSLSGWEKAVASMARRAHVDGAQQSRILAYLAVASKAVNAE